MKKKSSKSSLKKRSPDISLQHKNQATYKFSKNNFCTWPKKGLELKGLRKKGDVGGEAPTYKGLAAGGKAPQFRLFLCLYRLAANESEVRLRCNLLGK